MIFIKTQIRNLFQKTILSDILTYMNRYINQNLNRWKTFKSKYKHKHPKRGAALETIETLVGAFIIAMILRQFIVQSSLGIFRLDDSNTPICNTKKIMQID